MKNELQVAGVAVLSVAWSMAVSAQGMQAYQGGDAKDLYVLESSYTAESGFKGGHGAPGDMATTLVRAGYMHFWKAGETYSWGLGPALDYAHFDSNDSLFVPEEAYGVALRFANIWRFSEGWTFRFEIRPGLYSDFKDISFDDFNAPALLTLGYEVNPRLLVGLGVNVNFRSDLATIGGPGLRWRMADDWTLNLFLPRPTLDFAVSQDLTAYGGGEWRGVAYRVSEEFGSRLGIPEFNDDDFSYRELRAMAGLRYQWAKSLRFAVEGGYAFHREARLRRSDLTLRGDGAPFVQVIVNGSF